jgi:hypothetical protein
VTTGCTNPIDSSIRFTAVCRKRHCYPDSDSKPRPIILKMQDLAVGEHGAIVADDPKLKVNVHGRRHAGVFRKLQRIQPPNYPPSPTQATNLPRFLVLSLCHRYYSKVPLPPRANCHLHRAYPPSPTQATNLPRFLLLSSMRGFKSFGSADCFCRAFDEVRNFLRPTCYINQTISLARRRVIHVERVAALRDLISAA